ncbi:MAG TPA: lytic murein transglycosylase [Gaiellaceae bacterium]|nr:lytic murein transglycosylase [Gaiellaceae bacterium]
MRRCLGLIAVLLAVCTGAASADVYQVLPTQSTVPDLTYPQLLGLWQQAGAQYDVPWQVLAAINKVESNFGRNMGPSSAGAIGWMQFEPGTWLEWGYDANGDGVADPWNPEDAIFSAARYLAAAGASSDLYGAVYAYNHADWYVQEVLGLANLYAQSPSIAPSLDQMQQQLDSARTALAQAAEQLQQLEASKAQAPLLSARLAFEPKIYAASLALAQAKKALTQAQQNSAAASFTPAAANVLGAPVYSSGYVFPVGGGAGVVFASHTHHDYPAVDIAAPLGSPEYALDDSIVLRAWSRPDPSCGIGLTLAAADGQVWTYCHLAVLDPAVVVGAHLTAGEQVGLVGQTGDATGPHLHLQLQPPDRWPQAESWFQAFAGTAFTWSDGQAEPTRSLQFVAAPAAAQRVFAVVPQTRVVLFSRG